MESPRKLSDTRDEIVDLFEKGTFPYKGKEEKKKKKKNQKKTIFLNILRMNQKVLTMICLKNLLIL